MSAPVHGDAQREIDALHFEEKSRLAAYLRIAGPDVALAGRLARLLHVESLSEPSSSTTRLPRRSLFGSSIVDLQPKSGSDVDTYSTLQDALPDWYEAHNRHCGRCRLPLLLGINASFSHAGATGLLCRCCQTLNVYDPPSRDSKRALRRRRADAPTAGRPAKRKAEGAVSPQPCSPVLAPPTKAPTTLAERQAEVKRKARESKKAAAAAPAKSEHHITPEPPRSTISSAAVQGGEEKQLISKASPSESRLSLNNKKPARPKEPKPSKDAIALQAMLEKNRKRKEEMNKKPTPKTGLQDFLGSL